MQLHSVHIENYKNLHDFHVDLSGTNGVAVIVGPNGSGKSNILEALALIFAEIMGFVHNHNQIDRYEISYEIDGVIYNATKSNGKLEVKNPQGEDAIKGPDGIIGAYCGEFNRLFDVGFKDLAHTGYQSGMLSFSGDDYELVTLCAFLTRKWQTNTLKGSALALIGRPVRISFLIINEERGWSDSSESEADEILRRLASAKRNKDGRIEMPFSRFQRVFNDVISGWRLLDGADIYIIISQLLTQSEYAPFIGAIDLILKNERGEEFSFSDLSEGEKHLMMYTVLYENIVNSGMLVLLDEPDAYLHENWKQSVFERIKYWGEKGRMTVLTTHSPILIDTIPSAHIFFLHSKHCSPDVISGGKLDAVLALTNGRMATFRHVPIVLFEGKYDVNYVRRAFASLRRCWPRKYKVGDLREICDMVPCGGASCISYFYRKYREAFPDRPIVVFYDRDSGANGIKRDFAYYFNLDANATTFEADLELNHVYSLPKPKAFEGMAGNSYNEWAIEDYIGKKYLNKLIVSEYLKRDSYVSHKTIPKIRDEVKTDLGRGKTLIPDAEWKKFAPLVDKLLNVCSSANPVPFRPLPECAIIVPIVDATPTTFERVDSLIAQSLHEIEVFLCGVGLNVSSDVGFQSKYNGDYRIKLVNCCLTSNSQAKSRVQDSCIISKWRIDSLGLQIMDVDLLRHWMDTLGGNRKLADQILQRGFINPSASFVGK